MKYLVILLAILGISAVQLIVKYRFNAAHGPVPADATLFRYLMKILTDGWLWSAGTLLILAAVLWYFSLSRMPLSVATAFASLVYPTVIFGSFWFLGEAVRYPQVAGCILIVAGIWLVAAYS